MTTTVGMWRFANGPHYHRDSVGPAGDLYSSLRAFLMVADRPEWFGKKIPAL